MSRVHYWQTLTNDEGQPVKNATVSVYLAGTNTPVTFYTDETSSATATTIYTDTNGKFEFWIGDTRETYGYDFSQKFRIVWSSPQLQDGYIDYEDIFPLTFPMDETDQDVEKNKSLSNYFAYKWENHSNDLDANPHPRYLKKDGTTPLSGDWDTGTYKISCYKIQGRDSRGISLVNESGNGLVIEDDNAATIPILNIEEIFSLRGSEIIATAAELNSLSGKAIGLNVIGAIVTTTDTQTLTNKKIISPLLNSDIPLTATSTDLNQLSGVSISDLVAGTDLAFTRIDSPKINEDVACNTTSTELNRLHNKVIGGTGVSDITDNSSTQTLTNKTLNTVKINENVVLVATSTEINQLHGKTMVDITSVQTLSYKTLVSPKIADFTGATHDHSSVSKGGTLSHSNLTGLSLDSHTQYAKKASTETISGQWTFSTPVVGQTPVTASHYATRGYVDGKVTSFTGVANYFADISVSDHSDPTLVGSVAYYVQQIGSNYGTIILYGNTTFYFTAFTTALTIPSNVTLYFYRGAQLNIANGKTLTLNCSIITQNQQIFAGNGSVAGTLTRNGELNPIWFGFKTTSSSSINAAAIQNTLSIAPSASTIEFLPGSYQVSGPINVTKSTKFKGNRAILTEQSSDKHVFSVNTADKVEFSELTVNGRSDVTRTANGVVVDGECDTCLFDDCSFNYHASGVYLKNALRWTISKCQFENNRSYGVYIANISDITNGCGLIFDSYFDGSLVSTLAGIFYVSGRNIKITNCNLSNIQYGVSCNFTTTSTSAGSDLNIEGNSFDNVTVAGINLTQSQDPGFVHLNISNNKILSNGPGIICNSTLESIIINGNNIKLTNPNTSCILLHNGNNILINSNIIDVNNQSNSIGINNLGAENVSQNINMFVNCDTFINGAFI